MIKQTYYSDGSPVEGTPEHGGIVPACYFGPDENCAGCGACMSEELMEAHLLNESRIAAEDLRQQDLFRMVPGMRVSVARARYIAERVMLHDERRKQFEPEERQALYVMGFAKRDVEGYDDGFHAPAVCIWRTW